MGQMLAAILIMLFIIFTFIPLAALNDNHIEVQRVKQNLNLAARAVCNSVESSAESYESLADGYENKTSSGIKIDLNRLLSEFYDILEKNYYSPEFEKVKNRIYLKILVYGDRFYIADRSDQWSPPYFFNTFIGPPVNDIAVVSALTDDIYYYNNSGKVFASVYDREISMTLEDKNDIIIDKLNNVIMQYTFENTKKSSLSIKIRNPERTGADYKLKYGNFNVLDGITFFVLYAEDDSLYIDNRAYSFKNYNVTGYTYKIRRQ